MAEAPFLWWLSLEYTLAAVLNSAGDDGVVNKFLPSVESPLDVGQIVYTVPVFYLRGFPFASRWAY